MKKNEVVPEPPSYLVLMPFQPPAKVFFEHIKMGQEAVRILKIRNPSDNPINVSYLWVMGNSAHQLYHVFSS